MRLRAAILLLTAATLPGSSFAKDKPPISLTKASMWEINYDADSCHLLSAFGSGDQQTVLNLTRYEPGDPFEMTLIGKTVASVEPKPMIDLQFGAAEPAQRLTATAGTIADKRHMVIITYARFDGAKWQGFDQPMPPPVGAAQETAITSITFKLEGAKSYRLETGSLGAPMAAVRTCTDSLLKSWGYDPIVQAHLSKPATPTKAPQTWLRSSDYPHDALWSGHNGIVQFRLDIDAAGNVNGCHVLHRTNPDDFADLTCKLIAGRAHFSPALDTSGKPVKSFFVSSVIWSA